MAGYKEDKIPIEMRSPIIVSEGDGMFVIGKQNCGVGRWHSKQHIYVVTEWGLRKTRRKVVENKAVRVLEVFSTHILEGTVIMVDLGQENTYFDQSPLVEEVFKIPGPIHVDPIDP